MMGMEQFYAVAYRLFQEGRINEAADALFFLTAMNPTVHIYWLAFGMAEQSLERYQEALSAYAMAALTEPENPVSFFHSALCYQALQDEENMRLSLETALQYFDDNPEYGTMKAAAQLLLRR